MVRVIVTCEGFENVVYTGGVWLSTNGCYDWPALIRKALGANGVWAVEAECYLMGVPVDIRHTDLDVLQNNDTLVLKPKPAHVTERRSKRARESSAALSSPRRKVKRGEIGPASHMQHSIFRKDNSSVEDLHNKKFLKSEESQRQTTCAPAEPLSKNPAPTAFRFRLQDLLKFLSATQGFDECRAGADTLEHRRLSEVIELYKKYIEDLPASWLYRAFMEEAGTEFTLVEDSNGELIFFVIEHVCQSSQSDYPRAQLCRSDRARDSVTRGSTSLKEEVHRQSDDSRKISNPELRRQTGSHASRPPSASTGGEAASRCTSHKSMNFSSSAAPDPCELLQLRVLYCIGPGAPRREWFFKHVILPYYNQIPLIAVAAHIQDFAQALDKKISLSQIIDDALNIGSLQSDYFHVVPDATGKRTLKVANLSAEEELKIYVKRKLDEEAAHEGDDHLIATVVAGDKHCEPYDIPSDDCPFCQLIHKFLTPDQVSSAKPSPEGDGVGGLSGKSEVQSSSEEEHASSMWPKNHRRLPSLDQKKTQIDDQIINEASSSSSSSSSDESSDSESTSSDESMCQVEEQGGGCFGCLESVGKCSAGRSEMEAVRDCISKLARGRVLQVGRIIEANHQHAGRSSEDLNEIFVGSLVGIAADQLVLKNRFTNATHCIPLDSIVYIKDAVKPHPCLLYKSSSEFQIESSSSSSLPPSSPDLQPSGSNQPAGVLDDSGLEYVSFPDSLRNHPILSNREIPMNLRTRRDLGELNKWILNEISILKQRILRQCSWYFSERNLKTDKFLMSRLRAHGGKVPLKLLMSFNRIAALTSDNSLVMTVLREAGNSRLAILEEDGDIFVSPVEPLNDLEQPDLSEDPRSAGLVPSVVVRRQTQEIVRPPPSPLASPERSSAPTQTTAITSENPLLASKGSGHHQGLTTEARNEIVVVKNSEFDCQSSEMESASTSAAPALQGGSVLAATKNLIGARPRNAPAGLNF